MLGSWTYGKVYEMVNFSTWTANPSSADRTIENRFEVVGAS